MAYERYSRSDSFTVVNEHGAYLTKGVIFMKRLWLLGIMAVLAIFAAGPAMANTMTFNTLSGNVDFSVSDNGFYVRSAQIPPGGSTPGLNASSYISGSNFNIAASTASPYTDAGIVLFFNGGLTLGALQSVTIASTGTGTPLSMNLWLDTSGDGKFFAFNGSGLLTGLNGDTYAGSSNSTTYNASSSFYMLGGNGAGGTYTLAQLDAGAVAGIGPNTPTALWIGQVGPFSAQISSVQVSTVPIPGAMWLLGTGLFGLVGLRRRFKK